MLDSTLRIMATIISIFIIALGAKTLLTEAVTLWGGSAMTFSLIMMSLAMALAWRYRTSFFTLAAYLYSSILVGRLFSTLRLPEDMVADGGAALDPLLLGETGPGVPIIMYLSYALVILIVVQIVRVVMTGVEQSTDNSENISVNDWAMTFLRAYVGLMFIAHYSGHVLAGPDQFQIFANYFAGVGFHIGGPMVVLAGIIEIAVSIGLVFGFMTRLAAVGGSLYLFFATLWGDHFAAGYIWVLPNSGWEFSALWIAVILTFAVTGGSKVSFDKYLQQITPQWLNWCVR